MNEEYNAFVDNVTDTLNYVCKDANMLDRFIYMAVMRLMDKFGVSAEEAFEFWVSTSEEAYKFALNMESEE